jgi:hypothetical protein
MPLDNIPVRHKRGDIREDGYVFWSYLKTAKCGERWVSPEQFEKERYLTPEKKAVKKEQDRRYRENNTEKCRARSKQYRETNAERVKEGKRKEQAANRASYRQRYLKFKEKNPERVKDIQAAYRQRNKDQINHRSSMWSKTKRESDPIYRMIGSCRARTGAAIRAKGYKKESSTEHLLGCSWDSLRDHLEAQFTEGMTWDNYGKWHVDHVIPVSSAKTLEQLLQLCHFSNLQPLWAIDNLTKHSKIYARNL